jgi:hypothetical protein
MRAMKSRSYAAIPDVLLKVIGADFNGAPLALELFDEFLSLSSYDRDFALRLIESARSGRGESWEIRRLAALMLENQVLRLPADSMLEYDSLFCALGLKPRSGLEVPIDPVVLKEGYSTTALAGFIPEFRRRAGKLPWIHAGIMKKGPSAAAVRDFIELSRKECKLSLARYVFDPDEVVERILERVRITRGVIDIDPYEPRYAQGQSGRWAQELPAYEAAILKALSKNSSVYWVAHNTSSEINSLVEYPLTTVALVIKPPGSDMEFEIKRVGRRGAHALTATYLEGGSVAPPPHRIDGASMQSFLRMETTAAFLILSIYRRVYGEEAPVPRYIARSSIYDVPTPAGPRSIIDYFTHESIYGHGFREMRKALNNVVEAFKKEYPVTIADLPGELGQTVYFLGYVVPCQTTICGTSSFRLDRLNDYLSEGGPDRYFRLLGGAATRRDSKRLADEVLEEILGVYLPPSAKYESHEQYLNEAFSVPANRIRADENFLESMTTLGRFWGTLLGVRGYASGESFVPRNVGLKSVWERGAWKVKLIFMDHDVLRMGPQKDNRFHAHTALSGMFTDEYYIMGKAFRMKSGRGTIESLKEIYRVADGVAGQGMKVFYDRMKEGYRKTKDGMANDARLQSYFNSDFVKRLPDWDVIVAGYLKVRKNGKEGFEKWKAKAKRFLQKKGYDGDVIQEHLEAIEKYSGLLGRYSFVYEQSLDDRGET